MKGKITRSACDWLPLVPEVDFLVSILKLRRNLFVHGYPDSDMLPDSDTAE